MTKAALRPLNTRPIHAVIDGMTYTAVDADLIARRAFEAIDAARPDLRHAVATNFVDALATPEADKGALIARGSESLVSLCTQPGLPAPPVFLALSAAPAPLPATATIADARKWVLAWETAPSDNAITTMLTTDPLPDDSVEATPFERALLALNLDAIAATPVDAVDYPMPEVPDGPASGSATLDVAERAAVRAVASNGVAVTAVQSQIFEPVVDRNEEIAATLDEIAALEPSRVEVWYEASLVRLPVLLVIDNFDVPLVEGAIAQWRAQTEAPPDGELLFDVTAARLRLRRVVIR